MTVTECFETKSCRNVLRGLHYQSNRPQAKLVRACIGEVWDVAVDLRRDSPTFLKWYARTLSDVNREMLYISPGFAHGFFVLSRQALVGYHCFGAYDKQSDTGVAWNDPDLAVSWPIPPGVTPIISGRDRSLPFVREVLR